jgi:2-polyprenyl-3-methyl-5-hydroxy-6-metoxy-1,4-benzoquinol methylase
VACDIEPRLVASAHQNNPGVTIQQASVYALPWSRASIDAVVRLEVLEHLNDPEAALHELLRVTKNGLVLSVPREPLSRTLNVARARYVRDFGNTPGHLQHWSTRSFVRFIHQYADPVGVRTPLPWTVALIKKR